MENKKNIVAILGIDRFAPKNKYQTDYLISKGFTFHIFVTDLSNSLPSTLNVNVVELDKRFWGRNLQLMSYLQQNRSCIHHCEVYIGGRFSPFYMFLLKCFSLTSVVVERGEIREFFEKRYPFPVRVGMWLSYKLADYIWYKEHFMEDFLEKLGKKKRFFLPNAVEMPQTKLEKREIDFLFLNRFLPFRNVRWFVDAALQLKQKDYSIEYYIVGAMGDNASPEVQVEEKYVKKCIPLAEHYRLVGYSDPDDFFRSSKFFIFPSEYVFCNHALLEAMSHGVIPIVSNQPGASLIVDHGKNGFLIEHNKDGVLAAMKEALSLDDTQRSKMSNEAKEKVRTNFSTQSWGKAMLKFYNEGL
jgi:glycosyltransferase involved in cell wall biosynthesis